MINGNSYIGKRIGNYRLVEKLACGSFGCVYRAEHASFPNRIVAVKLLHTQIASQGVREEFLREAQPLEKLKHPHILSIIDTDIDGELPYLVTEYAYKGSLRGRLNLNQQSSQLLPMSEAITILTQIGEALQYAHDKGVIHRDIKPENILFNAEGEAILADFGISIVTDSTTRADLVGTCPYMAPEQFQGIVSKKSDQYALGCVAYELFTGNRPFTLPPDISPNTAWFVWANIHTHELPILPRQHNPQLPLYIEQTILKAMEKDRENRYKDVTSFVAALHKSPQQWFDEAKAHYQAQRYEEALAAYEEVIKLDPNYIWIMWAWHDKGKTLNALERYQEALVAFERAIALDQKNTWPWTEKGQVLRDLKRHSEALVAFEHAIALDANNGWAWHGKGLLTVAKFV